MDTRKAVWWVDQSVDWKAEWSVASSVESRAARSEWKMDDERAAPTDERTDGSRDGTTAGMWAAERVERSACASDAKTAVLKVETMA
jgi:hypothetical protein